MNNILNNLLSMGLSAFILLLWYCLRSNMSSFDLTCWLKTNQMRLAIGTLLILALSVFLEISPDFAVLLEAIGLNTNKSPVILGLAIGGLLIATISGDNAKLTKN